MAEIGTEGKDAQASLTLRLHEHFAHFDPSDTASSVNLSLQGEDLVFSCLGKDISSLSALAPLHPLLLSELRRLNPSTSEEAILYLSHWLFRAIRRGHKVGLVTFDGLAEMEHRRLLSVSMAGLPPWMYDWLSVPLRLVVSRETLVALLAAGLGGAVGVTVAQVPSVEAFLAGAATGELALLINYLSQIPPEKTNAQRDENLDDRLTSIESSLDQRLQQIDAIETQLQTCIAELHTMTDHQYSLELQLLLKLLQGPQAEKGLASLGDPSCMKDCLQAMTQLGIVNLRDGQYALSDTDVTRIREQLILIECQKAVADGKERWIRLRKVGFKSRITKVDTGTRKRREYRLRARAPIGLTEWKTKWIPLSQVVYIKDAAGQCTALFSEVR